MKFYENLKFYHCQTRSQVLRFCGRQHIFLGRKEFCFYYISKTNFSWHTKFGGHKTFGEPCPRGLVAPLEKWLWPPPGKKTCPTLDLPHLTCPTWLAPPWKKSFRSLCLYHQLKIKIFLKIHVCLHNRNFSKMFQHSKHSSDAVVMQGLQRMTWTEYGDANTKI